MTTSQVDPLEGKALPPLKLPDGNGALGLADLARHVEKALSSRAIRLKPQDSSPELKDFLKLYTTRLPDPIDPDLGEVDYVVVAAAGDWTPTRVDAFIAKLAPHRVSKGMPLFHIYSEGSLPPEITFLFESVLAGVFEIMAWELIEEGTMNSQDCIDLAASGRRILSDLYDVNLEPDDLQWLSVVNQLVLEEFRWFSDDPSGALPKDVDYVPHAGLMLLGAVAGEAIRLNHTGELVWTDADGLDWPRLGRIGTGISLPVVDSVFRRFEAGAASDLWDSYELLFASGRLSPPVSLGGEVNPLDFLPAWDPSPDMPLKEAVATFRKKCKAANIALEEHPHPEEALLAESLVGFTCYHDEQCYDLFVSTAPWSEELTLAFLRFYGHRSFEDWEIGLNPVFVFFSGHPLSDLLEYAFIQGPPNAPLEGLARVETPAPSVPQDLGAPDMVALWLVQTLELYTTIGLDLSSPSVLPGLEFFLREDMRFDPDLILEAEGLVVEGGKAFEPLGLLVAVGMTAGTSLITQNTQACAWRWEEGARWPVMDIGSGEDKKCVDWVDLARAIWRGDADEFGV